MRELYPNVRVAAYSSHSVGHPARYPRKAFMIVRLNRSNFPFVWGCSALENTFSIPRSRHTARENLAPNWDLLSVRTCLVGPYVNTQCLQNAFATIYAVVLLRGTVLVSLENRSVMTKETGFHVLSLGVDLVGQLKHAKTRRKQEIASHNSFFDTVSRTCVEIPNGVGNICCHLLPVEEALPQLPKNTGISRMPHTTLKVFQIQDAGL
jgi:hypothetical protein